MTEGKQDLENELEDVCRENEEFQDEIKMLKEKLTETESSAAQRDARVKELEAETTKLKQAAEEANAAAEKRAAEMAAAAVAGVGNLPLDLTSLMNCSALYSTIFYYTPLYSTLLRYSLLYSTLLDSTSLHSILFCQVTSLSLNHSYIFSSNIHSSTELSFTHPLAAHVSRACSRCVA